MREDITMNSPRPIKVMQVIARMNVGGPAVLVADLMRNLNSTEFKSVLVTGFCDENESDYLDQVAVDIEAIKLPGFGRSISATKDLKLVRAFADIARQEWAAVGLRKGYMYMADLSTEPRWQRVEGTFGEDAVWVAKMIREVVLGFQGNKLNQNSVALTTKHFPGGGATEGGQDPHFNWGKNEVFPGGMFNNNLIPFKAAIQAGTSAIMPYYSIPNNTEYEKIAYAYNKGVLQGLLRKQLGFKGIINSIAKR